MNDRADPIGQLRDIQKIDDLPSLFLNYALFLENGIYSSKNLRFVGFQGQESVSEPFEYQLELYNELGNHPLWGEANPKPDFDDIIGRPITVGIQRPADATRDELTERFNRAVRGGGAGNLSLFNGIVASVSMETLGIVRVTMKPALWRLTLTNNYRVHREKNIRDAIADLLDRHRIAYSMDAVSGDDNPAIARIQDWLQAGETDYDFLRRLMGKAHLYYYFVHSGNGHKVVFANRPAYPQAVPGGKPLRYAFTAIDELGLTQDDVIFHYSYQQSLLPSSVRAVFTRQEAAWEEDPVAQLQSFEAQDRPERGELPFHQYKIYQYGCSTEEVRHFTDATSQAMQTSGSQLSGASHCAHFRCGHQFGMVGYGDVNGVLTAIDPALENRRFVLTQVKHEAKEDGVYKNEFQAAPANGLISPFSVQETQQGAVLAKVIAHHRSVPPEDWRYYTKDYFEPGFSALIDSEGAQQKLMAAGVYVRFSTDDESVAPVWIKLAASMQTVPEIGVTVTVTRAQDESELPEIQGIVENDGSMVVAPSGWTANTHVGSSYSTSYGDGKSIRFGRTSAADLDRAVRIVCVPYDSGLYGNTSYGQGASYSFSTAESTATRASDLAEMYGPYGEQGKGDLLSASESFGSTFNRQYATVSSGYSNISISYSKSIIGTSESISDTTTQKSTSTVGTSTSTSTIGTNTSTSTIGSSSSTDTIGLQQSTQTIGLTQSLQAVGLSNSVSLTGLQNSMSTVGLSNQLSLNGITNGVNLTGISCNASLTGISTSVGATGIRDSAEAVGISTSASLTGVSVNDSLVGVSTGTSLTGISASTSVTGISANTSSTGISANTSNTLLRADVENVTLDLTAIIKELQTQVQEAAAGVQLDSGPAVVRTDISGPAVNMPIILLVM
ncbi:MAG TPA: phage late control D family protein [Paucimonas sp.]|nr:phage late control D family protein [Paucimonas sp.]